MTIFTGTSGNDQILRNLPSSGALSDPAATGTLTGAQNEIYAGAGNEANSINGGAGADTLFGGYSTNRFYAYNTGDAIIATN